MKTTLCVAALIAALFTGQTADAQVMLQKAVVSSAGSYAANGQTVMIATVAQPAVGVATNGTTVIQYGFWNGGTAAVGVAPALTLATGLELKLWPNPASSIMQLGITMKSSAPVEVILFDEAGRIVSRANCGQRAAGRFTIPLDVSKLASGSYTAAVSVPGEIAQERINVVR